MVIVEQMMSSLVPKNSMKSNLFFDLEKEVRLIAVHIVKSKKLSKKSLIVETTSSFQ